jgi:hypothetical protein
MAKHLSREERSRSNKNLEMEYAEETQKQNN